MSLSSDRITAIHRAWNEVYALEQRACVATPCAFSTDFDRFYEAAMALSKMLTSETNEGVNEVREAYKLFIRTVNDAQRSSVRTLSGNIQALHDAGRRMSSAIRGLYFI